MKIKRLELTNFRIFEQATFDFQPGMNLLIGINGVGKSSVLDALRMLLSQTLPMFSVSKSRPQYFKADDVKAGRPQYLKADDVKAGFSAPTAEIQFEAGNIPFTYTVGYPGTLPATSKQLRGELKPNTEGILNSVKQSMEQPLAVYFSTRRSLPIMKAPNKQSSTEGRAAAFAGALSHRGLRLRAFAEWWLVQQAFSRTDDPDSRRRRHLLEVLTDAAHQFLGGYTPIRVVPDAYKMPMIMPSSLYDSKIPESYLAPRIIDPDKKLISTDALGPLTIALFDKNHAQISAQKLSDGERGILVLVFDLARRLSLANPELDDPLRDGEAVVLIDELDLHLHPSWQRTVIEKLTTTFPNCQFIATTHSPQIIGECDPVGLILLTKEEGKVVVTQGGHQGFGLDSSWILEHLMGTDPRNVSVQIQINRVEDAIEEGNLQLARESLGALRQTLHGDDGEVVRLEASINNLEALADEVDSETP